MSDNQSNNSLSQQTTRANKLTRLVKQFIDFCWFFSLITLTIWPVVILVVGINIPADSQQRHTDVDFNLNFKVYSHEVNQPNLNHETFPELIQGQSAIKLNNTHSSLAWYYSGFITEIMGLIGLVALFYARKLFTNLVNNRVFIPVNANLIKNIGYILIGSSLLYPFLIYFGGAAILADVGEHHPNIILSPAINIDLIGLFTGLAIIVLAGIMKEASIIHEEQSLTI